MRIIRVQNKAYAIGLWWQMSTSEDNLRSQARSANTAINGNFSRCVLLPKQFGLACACPKSLGVPSLAAALARSRKEATVLLCHLPMHGCYWVFACKDGLVAAEGDRDFSEENEALAHAESLALMLDVPKVERVSDVAALLPTRSRAQRLFQSLVPYAPVVQLASPWPKIRRIGYVLALLLIVLLVRSIDFQDESSDIGNTLKHAKQKFWRILSVSFQGPGLRDHRPKTGAGPALAVSYNSRPMIWAGI